MSERFEPEITVLYCGRGLVRDDYLPEGMKRDNGFKVRFVMMPCSSKVESGYLVKLIEQGSDGVTMVICPQEECQFMTGSTRAGNRVNYAKSLLADAGMDADRLAVVEGQGLSSSDYMTIAEKCAEAIKPLGTNPMKSTK